MKRTVLVTNGNVMSMIALAQWLNTYGRDCLAAIVLTKTLPSVTSNVNGVISMARTSGLAYASYKVWVNRSIPLWLKMQGLAYDVPSFCRAQAIDVPVISARNVNAAAVLATIRGYRPDILLSFSSTQKFSPELISLASRVTLNAHFSLLPAYAGLSPYFWYLRNKEDLCGSTFHVVIPKLDAGPIIEQDIFHLAGFCSVTQVMMRQAQGISRLLHNFYAGRTSEAQARPQDLSQRSYYRHPAKHIVKDFLAQGYAFVAKGDARLLLNAVRALYYSRTQPRNQSYPEASPEIRMSAQDAVAACQAVGQPQQPDWQERYLRLLEQTGQKHIFLDGVLWVLYNRMVVPVGPVATDYSAACYANSARLLRFFPEALLVRAGGGFVTAPDSWFAVICDQFRDTSALSANTRSKLRRGQKQCTVNKVDAALIARQGWAVHKAASLRTKQRLTRLNERQFARSVALTGDFADIVDYWGVFEQSSNQLLAYAQNYRFGQTEVFYVTIDFDPAFFKLYPSYALFYQMNRYYLHEQQVAYVNEGLRNLLHQTNIYNYLQQTFFFKAQPVGLTLAYRPLLKRALDFSFPARGMLRRLDKRLNALYTLEELHRQALSA